MALPISGPATTAMPKTPESPPITLARVLGGKTTAAMGTALDCKVGAAWEHDTTGTLVCAETWYAPGFAGADFVEVTRGFRFAPGEGLPGRVVASSSRSGIRGASA